MPTIEDIVTRGVEAQAQIDKHLAKAYEWAAKLTTATEDGVREGMIQGIGAKGIIGMARAAQGKIGDVAQDFAALHSLQTAACVAAGVDLGSVTTAGGIPIGGVHTEGGGRG